MNLCLYIISSIPSYSGNSKPPSSRFQVPSLKDLKLIYSMHASSVSGIMGRYFDLRSCIVVLINMVKSFRMRSGVSWDVMNWTWTNLFSFILVLAVFSFVSIEVPLTLFTLSFHTFHIRLLFGSRPLLTALAFIASLIFPQRVFCYVYLLILLLSFYPTDRLVHRALRSLQAVIPINHVYHIFIRADVEVINEAYP